MCRKPMTMRLYDNHLYNYITCLACHIFYKSTVVHYNVHISRIRRWPKQVPLEARHTRCRCSRFWSPRYRFWNLLRYRSVIGSRSRSVRDSRSPGSYSCRRRYRRCCRPKSFACRPSFARALGLEKSREFRWNSFRRATLIITFHGRKMSPLKSVVRQIVTFLSKICSINRFVG